VRPYSYSKPGVKMFTENNPPSTEGWFCALMDENVKKQKLRSNNFFIEKFC
jgi:hypothetical protein